MKLINVVIYLTGLFHLRNDVTWLRCYDDHK